MKIYCATGIVLCCVEGYIAQYLAVVYGSYLCVAPQQLFIMGNKKAEVFVVKFIEVYRNFLALWDGKCKNI